MGCRLRRRRDAVFIDQWPVLRRPWACLTGQSGPRALCCTLKRRGRSLREAILCFGVLAKEYRETAKRERIQAPNTGISVCLESIVDNKLPTHLLSTEIGSVAWSCASRPWASGIGRINCGHVVAPARPRPRGRPVPPRDPVRHEAARVRSEYLRYRPHRHSQSVQGRSMGAEQRTPTFPKRQGFLGADVPT